jgi:hypothetical protein
LSKSESTSAAEQTWRKDAGLVAVSQQKSADRCGIVIIFGHPGKADSVARSDVTYV